MIYGIGGHAKVTAELAMVNNHQVAAFFDDAPEHPVSFQEIPVYNYDAAVHKELPLLIAVGNNATRKSIAGKTMHRYCTLKHPSAVVASNAEIKEGTVILSLAVIQPDVKIGRHCLINIACAIDHEAVIGDFAHIAPGCYIGGGAVIGEGAVIGHGAVIMRNVHIPAWASILPGSIVTG